MYADLQQRAYSIFVDGSGKATHLSFISAVSALARGSPQEKFPRTPSLSLAYESVQFPERSFGGFSAVSTVWRRRLRAP
jgi:hypothetical protein